MDVNLLQDEYLEIEEIKAFAKPLSISEQEAMRNFIYGVNFGLKIRAEESQKTTA